MLYLNGHEVEENFFPNRETYIDIPNFVRNRADADDNDKDFSLTIGMRFEGNDDLINLMFLKRHLDDLGYKNVALNVPYFPYSTMDHTDKSRPLSLKYAAELINSLGFTKVSCLEPHSTVVEALVNNLDAKMFTAEVVRHAFADRESGIMDCSAIGRAIEKHGRIFIVYPDAGAAKRYKNLVTHEKTCDLASYAVSLSWDYDPIIVMDKERRFSDGKLGAMVPLKPLPEFGEKDFCVIVDDLCRKGRTFTGCADALRAAGAKHVILCVTHLERIADHGVLLPDSSVDKVYATDSCLTASALEKLKAECDKLVTVNVDY